VPGLDAVLHGGIGGGTRLGGARLAAQLGVVAFVNGGAIGAVYPVPTLSLGLGGSGASVAVSAPYRTGAPAVVLSWVFEPS
jgi:hypothetical protein